MKAEYITIPVWRVRQVEDECYTSVAKGLFLVALGVAVWIGILVCLWGMTIRALGAEPKADIIPPDYETRAVIISATDLYAVEYDNRVNPSQLTDAEWAALLEACEENRIAPSLALGLIQVESNFDPGAVSSAGCYGYTQINPRWHPANLAPVENIRYGIGYLAECIARYDNLEAGLTAYNAGHDTGSRRYANRVLAAAEEWEGRP